MFKKVLNLNKVTDAMFDKWRAMSREEYYIIVVKPTMLFDQKEKQDTFMEQCMERLGENGNDV